MLSGTFSQGNGGIAEYSWSFTHKGSKRILTGETTSFMFEEAGEYDVTLTVTDFRGRTDEVVVTLTLINRAVDEFILFVGPVMDQHNLPIVGARVELTIGDDEYYETTMADGVAYFTIPGSMIGQEVDIYVTGDDFDPVSLTTTITPDGQLDRSVPAVESKAGWEQPGKSEDGGGIPAWMIGAIIAVIVVLLLLFLIFTKRIGGKKRDSFEELETEAEGTPEETEVEELEELENGTLVVDVPDEGPADETPPVEPSTEVTTPEPEEEAHVVTPPIPAPEIDEPKVDFKDLPRSSVKKQPEQPVERKEDGKALSSVAADSEVEDATESTDTDI